MPRAAYYRRRGVLAALSLLVISVPVTWSLSDSSPLASSSSRADQTRAKPMADMPPHESAHAGLRIDLTHSQLILPGPTTAQWSPALGPGSPAADPPQAPEAYGDRLRALGYEIPVFDSRDRSLGLLRYGSVVAARPTRSFSCSSGTPFELVGGGFACADDDLAPASGDAAIAPGDEPVPIPVFRATRPNPYRYARVIAPRAPRLSRLPASVDEAAALDADVASRARSSDLVSRWLVGDYFMAMSQEGVQVGEWTFFRTSSGNYVRARDLEARPLQPMHGERLGDTYRLPLGFVFRDSELLCERDGVLGACGRAEKHARFNVADPATIDRDGVTYVRGADGISVRASDVRVVRQIERPADVPADAKWIHVDLSQQALVAYEGDRPVYTTLVSSGRAGYETPGGLYRVERKYLSKTMRGKDIDTKRYYEVQEVPWTMYYDGNFAIHGAYWHNLFGMTKSHGCTNVPPVDARWLYYWTVLDVPTGWHGLLRQEGTWFYFSGKTPPDGQ